MSLLVETSKLAIHPGTGNDDDTRYASARLAHEARQASWNGYRPVRDITEDFVKASNGSHHRLHFLPVVLAEPHVRSSTRHTRQRWVLHSVWSRRGDRGTMPSVARPTSCGHWLSS